MAKYVCCIFGVEYIVYDTVYKTLFALPFFFRPDKMNLFHKLTIYFHESVFCHITCAVVLMAYPSVLYQISIFTSLISYIPICTVVISSPGSCSR